MINIFIHIVNNRFYIGHPKGSGLVFDRGKCYNDDDDMDDSPGIMSTTYRCTLLFSTASSSINKSSSNTSTNTTGSHISLVT